MVKAEKDLLLGSGHAMGRVNPSSTIFGIQTWSIGLSRQRTGSRRQRYAETVRSQVWPGWSWSQTLFWERFQERLQQVVHPEEGLLLDIVSIPCCGDVTCLSRNPRWLQSNCKEHGLEQKQIQNGDRDAKLLFLVTLWIQVRSQCFSAKAVWVPLTPWLEGKSDND
jgi:hypothetical protein